MVGVTGALIGAAVIGGVSSAVAGSKAAKAQKNAAQTAAAAQDRSSEVQLQIFNQTRADYAPWRDVGVGALGKLADMYGVPRATGATTPASNPALPSAANGFGTLPAIYGNYGDQQAYRSTRMISGEDWQPFGLAGQFNATGQPAAQTGGQTGGQPAMTPGFDGFQASPGYQWRVGEAMKAIERSAAARGKLRSGATMDALQRRVQGVASDEYENFANRLAALAGVGQSATAGTAQAGAQYGNSVAQGAAAQGNIALAAGNARASGYANTGNAINSGVQNLASAYLYNKGWGMGG